MRGGPIQRLDVTAFGVIVHRPDQGLSVPRLQPCRDIGLSRPLMAGHGGPVDADMLPP